MGLHNANYFSDPDSLDAIQSVDDISEAGLCMTIVRCNKEFNSIFEEMMKNKIEERHGKCHGECRTCVVTINNKRYKADEGLKKLEMLIPDLRGKIEKVYWEKED